MPDGLIISDTCLAALAKSYDSLVNSDTLLAFLKPWYRVEKHHVEILACLQSTSSSNDNTLTTRHDRKEALRAARASKKVKYIDDPIIAEKARIIALRDQWLVQRGKSNTATKAQIRKAAEAKKKEQEKTQKARDKNQQLQDIRRLTISNCREKLGTFRAALSDPHTEASSDPPVLPTTPIIQTPAFEKI